MKKSRQIHPVINEIVALLKNGGAPQKLWGAVTELAILYFEEKNIWISEEGKKQIKYELLMRIFKNNSVHTFSFVHQCLKWTLLNLIRSRRACLRLEIPIDYLEDTTNLSIADIYITKIEAQKYNPQKKTLFLEKKFLSQKVWKPKLHKTESTNLKNKKIQNKRTKQNKRKETKTLSYERLKTPKKETNMRKVDLQELLEKLRENLLRELPPIFARKDIEKLLPGVISPRTLENLDSLGKGPKGIINGKKILYTREEFVDWLINYLREKNQWG